MARESTIGSKFLLEDFKAATIKTAAVSGLTAGTTTTLTATVTDLKAGDFIRLKGDAVDRDVLGRLTGHRVQKVTAGAQPTDPSTIVLDVNTTGMTLPTAGVTMEMPEYTEILVAEFGLDAPSPNEVDVTTMRDLERHNVPGLANTGSATIGGPMDLSDKGTQLLIAAYGDGKPRSLVWITRGGQTGLIYGVVASFTGGPQGVEQAVQFSGTFQVQERPIYLPALVV